MRSARSGPGGRALTKLVTALLHAGAASVAAQAPAGAMPAAPGGPSFWGGGRAARTDASGAYRGLTVGDSLSLSAQLRDSAGTALDRPVFWSTTDSSVFVIEYAAGLDVVIHAQGAGTAVLEAASEGKTGQATITVSPPTPPAPVATVTVLPDSARMRSAEFPGSVVSRFDPPLTFRIPHSALRTFHIGFLPWDTKPSYSSCATTSR